MPGGRNPKRWGEDTWDSEPPSTSGQTPATLPADESTQLEPGRVTAMLRARTTRRRREDTWDAVVSAQPTKNSSPNSQDESVPQTSRDRARPLSSSGLMTWNEMLDASETPPADATISHKQQAHFRRLQEAYTRTPSRIAPALPEQVRLSTSLEDSRSAGSSAPEPAPPLAFQGTPPARPRPDSLSQYQQPGGGADCGPHLRPYRAPPVPSSLEEVRVPDSVELVAMEQIHGRPRPMPEIYFCHFHRGYGIPLEIASEMRREFMIGVHPSGLVYLDYRKLEMIPTRFYESYGEIPALYWARTLYLKQGDQREHIEHDHNMAPGPCGCKHCQYDREHRMMGARLR